MKYITSSSQNGERKYRHHPFESSGYPQTHKKPSQQHIQSLRAASCLSGPKSPRSDSLVTHRLCSGKKSEIIRFHSDGLLGIHLKQDQEIPAKCLIRISPQTMDPSLFVLWEVCWGSSFPQYRSGFQRCAQPESTARVGSGSRARFMFILLTSFPTLLQSKQKRNPGL